MYLQEVYKVIDLLTQLHNFTKRSNNCEIVQSNYQRKTINNLNQMQNTLRFTRYLLTHYQDIFEFVHVFR